MSVPVATPRTRCSHMTVHESGPYGLYGFPRIMCFKNERHVVLLPVLNTFLPLIPVASVVEMVKTTWRPHKTCVDQLERRHKLQSRWHWLLQTSPGSSQTVTVLWTPWQYCSGDTEQTVLPWYGPILSLFGHSRKLAAVLPAARSVFMLFLLGDGRESLGVDIRLVDWLQFAPARRVKTVLFCLAGFGGP